ncbi:hypothetical protein BDN72DRAFT_634017 [Pluteus cervinus]|uniref:Uncharacterized protein n=1 Tax=Pluteus cervinus TaxID=181527 RepID=A0ACD3BAF1_9AGAR|nr:hypothetical protein BDN72DRAFT_634017 [Pluteus cervinus]
MGDRQNRQRQAKRHLTNMSTPLVCSCPTSVPPHHFFGSCITLPTGPTNRRPSLSYHITMIFYGTRYLITLFRIVDNEQGKKSQKRILGCPAGEYSKTVFKLQLPGALMAGHPA